MKEYVKHFAIVCVFIFGFFLFATSYNIAGIRSFIVKSGSMEPAIPTGALVVTQTIQPSLLKPGDIITYVRPTKERDIVTHRVLGVATRNEYISIQTKGDHNNVPDTWQVGGGNVIGKVYLSIPWLGYGLSFIQSKLGILLFILIPAIYILVEEIATVVALFRKKENPVPEALKTIIIFVSCSVSFMVTTIPPTYAALTDTAILEKNRFTVLRPTIVPTQTTCGNNIHISISGNGVGSQNSVNVNNSCSFSIYQSNTLNAKTTVK